MRATIAILLMLIFSLTGYSATYYVSSSDGSDSDSGLTPSLAWATLTKVNAVWATGTFAPGDKILFKRGDSWVGTITVGEAGVSGNPITISAYGTGNKPKIYGSTTITGWLNYSGNIYQASVGSAVSQLFVDGVRMRLARTPNSGYHNTTSKQSSTQFTSTDLNGGINYIGATWVGRTTNYTMFSKTITAQSSQTLTIDSTPFDGALTVNAGFFMCDKLEFLDAAGEWYYNSSTGIVYLWTTNGDSPSGHTVRGSINSYGINFADKDYITVSNLEILHSSVTGAYINGASYSVIDSTDIISPDQYGICSFSTSNATYATITNSRIYQANVNGINLYGASSIITNNSVEDTGLLENINKTQPGLKDNNGTGIFVRYANQIISYNRVLNSSYVGINFQGVNNEISYNFVDNACLYLDDGGGIYTYNNSTSSAGSVVENNIVLHVYGNKTGWTGSYDAGFGIYMDNKTTDVSIINNIVAHTAGGVYLHENGNILVNGNTFFDNIIHVYVDLKLSNSTVTNNISYSTSRTGNFSWWTNTHQRMIVQSATAIFNNNKYTDHYVTEDIFGTAYNFTEWKAASGQDALSTCNNATLSVGILESLIYNDTPTAKIFDLGTKTYTNVDGGNISNSITLQPFASAILLGDSILAVGEMPPPTPDITDPFIISFTIPSLFESLVVPITSFTAIDDMGVTGYLLTESSITPLTSNPSWSGSAPTSYTFSSYGNKTLYAWVKDAAGNISAPSGRTAALYVSIGKRLFRNTRTGLIYNRNNVRQ